MAIGYVLISINTSSIHLVYIAVLIIAVSSTFGAAGEAVVPIDLTSKYSASIMAIANSVANLSGTILPPLVSTILAGELNSFVRWQNFWWILCTILISGGLVFASFMEADIQDFDYDDDEVITLQKGASVDSVIASDDSLAPVLISVNRHKR